MSCVKELQAAFNSNIKTRFDVQVAVSDFYAQKAFDVYRGFLQLFTIKRRQPRQQQAPIGLLDIAVPSLLNQQVNTASFIHPHLNSTQREFTDAGETPHCPHLFIKIKYKTIRHILLVLIYLQFRLGRL